MKKAIPGMILVLLAVSLFVQAQDGLAELHVQKIVLEPPSAVTRGEDVQVYARISNTGSRNADSFSVGFFYRPSREGEPWILLGARQEENLGPSQQGFLEVAYEFETVDMELGTYEIKVVADVSNQIPEVDELNNELRTSMVVVASTLGLPELQPTRLSFEQIGSSEMDPWRIILTVENTGEYLLSSYGVRFLVNGETMPIPIDPATPFIPDTGAATSVIGTLDPHSLGLDPGTYLITAIVDSGEQIAEQDEANNSISASLTIQTLELHPESLRFDRSIVRLDEEVRLTSEIANTGNGLAKNVKVSFYVDHLRFATTQIAQLGSVAEEVSVTLDAERLGLSDAPRVYKVTVVVDPDNALSESDEANNELVRTLTILPPQVKKPEIHPESLELTPASPAELGRADAVTVTSVIKNTGRADAEAFDVGFYYRVKGGRRWDAFPCADGVSCGEVALLAGAQATIVGILPVIALPPGIYEIRVAADTTDVNDELDETNNELVTTLTLLASRLPDLTVEILEIEPGISLQQGQTARISTRVSNVGELEADAVTARFSYCRLIEAPTVQQQQTVCADGDAYMTLAVLPDADVFVPPLGIGESTIVQVNVETGFLDAGQYRIRSEIDPSDRVRERNELNNIAVRTLSVQGPDLMPVAGSFRITPSGTIDQAVICEVEFDLTVLNAGLQAAGAYNVAFELLRLEDGAFETVRGRMCGDVGFECDEPPYFAIVSLPGIGAGAQQPLRCTLDLTAEQLEAGQYVVRAHVDCIGDFDGDGICEGQVPEHVELNNSAELLLTIIGGPTADGTGGDFDLSVASVNGRSNPGRVLAYGTVKNIGVSRSGTFSVTIEAVLPSGQVLRQGVVGLPPLAAGEQISVDMNFLEGIDFSGLLAVGDRVDVAIRVLTNDGNPDNNIATRRLTVRD